MDQARSRDSKGERGQIAVLSHIGPFNAAASVNDSVDSIKAFKSYRDITCGIRRTSMFSNMNKEQARDQLLYTQTDRLENVINEYSNVARKKELELKNRLRLERGRQRLKDGVQNRFNMTQKNGFKRVIL